MGEPPRPTPPHTTRHPTTWRQRLALIAFGLVLTAALLAAVEGVLALFGVGDAAIEEDPYVGFVDGTPLFELRRGEGGDPVYATRAAKLKFFNPQELAAEKPAGSLRVFALGGSTTAGRPYDDRVSFARWLARYLDAAEPGRRHEVVNAGAISYASYRIVVLMQELVRYDPDVFVIYTGHNEFLEERTYRDLIRQPPAVKWLRTHLARSRLAALVWGALDEREAERPAAGASAEPPGAAPPGTAPPARLGDEVQTRLDVWTGLQAFRRDEALRRSIVEHFAYNLERMVEIAEAHGVTVVFVAPVSNLKDFSPFKSEHGAGLSAAEVARVEALAEEGRRLLEAGDAASAAARFVDALAVDPDYADLHFRHGRALLAQGEHAAAHAAFVRAKELDVAPLRALEGMVAAVGEVASRHDLPLVDLPALLAAECQARLGHPILGNELLLDHVHPDIPVHSLIAEQVLEVLTEQGEVRIAPGWSVERRQALYDGVVAGLDREYYARRDLNLAKVLGWAGKLEEAEAPLLRAAEVLGDDPDLRLNLGTLYEKTGRPAAAAAELERAVALAPESPGAHFNLGVAYGRLGRLDDGIRELERAVELAPEYPEALYNLGVLQRRAGRAEAAVAATRRALDLRPGAAEIHRSLGLALRLAGRLDEAEAELRQSLRLAPSGSAAVATQTDLAAVLAQAGRFAEADAELAAALAVDPGDAEAWFNRGLLRAREGRPDEAAAAYEQAIQLAPDHAVAHNNLAILRAGRGDLETAHDLLRRAVELDPTYAEAFLNLGVVADHAGRPEEAVAAVRQAVELTPQNPRFHLALGLLLAAQNRLEEARPHLEAAHRSGEPIPAEVAARVGLE